MTDYIEVGNIGLLLWQIFNSSHEKIDNILVNKLKDIERETAIETLRTFPMHNFSEIDHPNIILSYLAGKLEYTSIYYWFKKWNNPLEYSLEGLQYVELYEKRALLSKARYQLIEAIKNEGEQALSLFSASCLWLLCEAACCFQQNITSLDSQPISKRKYYEINQKGNKILKDISQDSSEIKTSSKNFLDPDLYLNFNSAIELIARNLAKKSPDFDSNYYVPYFEAKQSFNREMRTPKFELLNYGDNPRQRQPNRKKN